MLTVGGFSLVGCENPLDGILGRDPIALEMTPLTTDTDLLPTDPVIVSSAPIPRAGDREHPAMLVRLVEDAHSRVLVVDPTHPEGIDLDLDPSVIAVHLLHDGPTVAVLASTMENGTYSHRLLTSTDMETWEEQEISASLGDEARWARSGLILGRNGRSPIPVHTLDEDGTLTKLTALPVADGEKWERIDAVRDGERIGVLLRRRGPEQARDAALVASLDGGTSWNDPISLASQHPSATPRFLTVQDSDFIVLGQRQVRVNGAEYAHPIAWSTADGTNLTLEQVPVAPFGYEGWENEDGPIDPETPLEDLDYRAHRPSRTFTGERLEVPFSWADTYAVARRSPNGEWVTEQSFSYLPAAVEDVTLADGEAMVLHERGVSHLAEEGRESSIVLRSMPSRSLSADGDSGGAQPMALSSWKLSRIERDEANVSWRQVTGSQVLEIDGDTLIPTTGAPSAMRTLQRPTLAVAEDGSRVLLGQYYDEDGVYRGARGWWHQEDGDWTEIDGLPRMGEVEFGILTLIDSVYYLPIGFIGNEALEADIRPRFVPQVWRSVDGITWEEDGEAGEPSRIVAVSRIGEELIGIGVQGVDVEEAVDDGNGDNEQSGDESAAEPGRTVTHGAVFRQQDGVWTPTLPDIDAEESYFSRIAAIDGVPHVFGWTDGDETTWTVGEDLTLTEVDRGADDRSRGPVLDLGDGAWVATGMIDDPEVAHGRVLWVTADAGEHWDPTVIPGTEGRWPSIELLRDEADLVILVEHGDGPRGHRIKDAATQLLGE
ncbi:MAG: hypothetical protein Q4G40_01190 [Brachybacterium sp.]|nr:hypothetical protein [Brachybacterium sp.]